MLTHLSLNFNIYFKIFFNNFTFKTKLYRLIKKVNKMKNVLITGASRGIGRQIAIDFAKNGYNVIINYNTSTADANTLKKEIENFNGSCYLIQADISNYSVCQRMVNDIISKFKHIDILINNAGICHEKLIIDEDEQSINEILDINLKGTIYTSKFVINNMVKYKYGKIINISSILGGTGCSNESIYSASKGAINALTKSLAKEYGMSNITVNAIAPGCVKTDMLKDFSNSDLYTMTKSISLNRLAEPIDISSTALFLASDAANYITGQIIGIDGGFII